VELGPFPDVAGYDEAVRLDADSPLAGQRDEFVVHDPDLLYLDGNSLGRLPQPAVDDVTDTLHRQWGDRLIRSWNEGWWEQQVTLGDLLAPVLGARRGEVIISESTTTNLFKLAVAALRARPGRPTVVTDDLNFPTDNYALAGACALLGEGRHLRTIRSNDGVHGATDELVAALDEDTALLSLSHTCFKSAFVHDLPRLTAAAHEAGALVLWDLSHSAGSVPVGLAEHGVDLAVGCTYKHLNGGPGAPAFLYVRTDLQQRLHNPIAGWWGHEDPFAFDLEFRPTDDIRRFHVGTMPMLSLNAAEAGVRQVAAVGIDALREVSTSLTSFLVEQADEHLSPLGFELASPRDPDRRGSHVALAHPDAWPITRALIEDAKVLPDFRAPDNLRLGIAPLYTTHVQVHTAVQRIAAVVRDDLHAPYRGTTAAVT
jgi:kynureninase